MDQDVEDAVLAIARHWSGRPRAAIILGTGLGPLAEEVRHACTIPYATIPGFPRSTALSHRGLLVAGKLAGETVAVMSGRCHRYEGYSADAVAFPVRVLHALGARTLIISNAAGGVCPSFQTGDVMAIAGHVNLQSSGPRLGPLGASPRGERSRVECYDPEFIAKAIGVGRRLGFTVQQGVYVGVTGPNYETRAEYRMIRRIGGDAVGMSTVAEATAAVDAGMRVLGLSVITNIARPDAPREVNASDVVRVAAQGAERLLHVVREVVAPRA